MYSAVEVADFVVDRHLHHGCVVEQCILVKSRTVVNYHGRDTFGGLWFLLMTFLMRFIFFIFIFFPATRVNVCSRPVRETCNQFGSSRYMQGFFRQVGGGGGGGEANTTITELRGARIVVVFFFISQE